MKSSRRSGTSLVEVLVVIVVFLVGILAIVQIFPGGFKVLSTTSKNSIANSLARAEMEILKNHADQLPDAIVPVVYNWNGSQIVISKQPDRFPTDLGPSYSNMGPDGTMYDGGGNAIGNWQFLTGANISRRVLGEGGVIPTPRVVGADYGSLLTLQFAPLIYNPTYQSIFVVYGNDLTKRQGDPVADGHPVRATEYYLDNEDSSSAKLTLHADPSKILHYEFDFSYYNSTKRIDIVSFVVDVPAQVAPYEVQLSGPGFFTDLLSMDYDSFRLARVFDDVTGGGFSPDPYEYKLLSKQLGLVLFNPTGFNYFVRKPGGRRDPLIGKVSYDVYDWRIIHDEFRVPDSYPANYRLAVGSLKVQTENGPDGTRNSGIGVQSPDSTGALQNCDLVLQDTDNGGIYVFQEGTKNPLLSSYTIDKSIGLINLLDYDSDPSNGTQMRILLPGAVNPVTITVTGRSMRALYMGKNEWAVQVLKPAAHYTETWGRPGIGQYYIGLSDPTFGLQPDRVYFPQADAGREVSLGEIYYMNANGPVGPVTLTAKVESNNMGAEQLPSIQMTSYFPDFISFDYSYGTAVKSVKGASIAVRVLWNPDAFRLSGDPAVNMDRLQTWMQSWRRSNVETYLQRGY